MKVLTWVYVLGVLSCGGATPAAVELQTAPPNDDIARPPEPSPSVAASTPPAPPQAYVQSCPFECAGMPPGRRDVSVEETARIREALLPTLTAMSPCVRGFATHHRHGPVLNLRFDPSGKLVDLGVDAEDFYDAEACLQGAVRGGRSPALQVEGIATVRCAERCVPAKRKPKR